MKAKDFPIAKRWMMVIGLSFIICHLSFSEAQAQPKQRRTQPKTEQQAAPYTAEDGAAAEIEESLFGDVDQGADFVPNGCRHA